MHTNNPGMPRNASNARNLAADKILQARLGYHGEGINTSTADTEPWGIQGDEDELITRGALAHFRACKLKSGVGRVGVYAPCIVFKSSYSWLMTTRDLPCFARSTHLNSTSDETKAQLASFLYRPGPWLWPLRSFLAANSTLRNHNPENAHGGVACDFHLGMCASVHLSSCAEPGKWLFKQFGTIEQPDIISPTLMAALHNRSVTPRLLFDVACRMRPTVRPARRLLPRLLSLPGPLLLPPLWRRRQARRRRSGLPRRAPRAPHLRAAPAVGGGLPARVGDASLRLSFVASLSVEDATVFVTGGNGCGTSHDVFSGCFDDDAEVARRRAADAEAGVSLPVCLATNIVRFVHVSSGNRDGPAGGGIVSASFLNAKPAVWGIGVEPRVGGVLHLLLLPQDAVMGKHHCKAPCQHLRFARAARTACP
ncbi:hypothetical protein FOA52_013057 [Chlamydomonas sp. UWO 241]|nr:hypothetical protein FOA52_013057 [Chlamydomonas sp. UWO 241]